MQEDPYPSLNLKAWNGRIFLVFLELCISLLAQSSSGDDREVHLASLACSCLSTWFDKTERAGRYLTASQAAEMAAAGRTFLDAYEKLAHCAKLMSLTRWKAVPKLHVPRPEINHLDEGLG